jgi:ADP-heptose:LPS heptosyltransferase
LKPKKILVIRLSSIGDIVLTTPVVRCLKKQLPGAVIHFAVKKQFLPVISGNPYIDKVHVFDGDLNALIKELRREKFSYIVDLHQNLRSWQIRLRLIIPSSGFPKLNIRKWLLTRYKLNKMPDVHIVDRYFKAVERLGVRNDGKGLDYFIPQEEEVDVNTLPNGFEKGFIAIVIGARHATKRLPSHKIITICKKLNRHVALLGGPEDAERANEIVMKTWPFVFSYCGKLTINQSASMVRQAEAVITNDTGLMHIAAAFKKRIISVWGNTVPEFGMTPYLPAGKKRNSVIFEVKGLPCRPCSKLGFDECPQKHFQCMEDLKPGEIVRKTVRPSYKSARNGLL